MSRPFNNCNFKSELFETKNDSYLKCYISKYILKFSYTWTKLKYKINGNFNTKIILN